jgi:hypothetical protein
MYDQNQGSVYVLKNLKGKAIPLQAWTGPEGSRSLRLPVEDGKVVSTGSLYPQ